jgi:hypothetical protein
MIRLRQPQRVAQPDDESGMEIDGVAIAEAVLDAERNVYAPHERVWIRNRADEMREAFERAGLDASEEAARLVVDIDKILSSGEDEADWRRVRYAAALVATMPTGPSDYATAA